MIKDRIKKKFYRLLHMWVTEQLDYVNSCDRLEGKDVGGWNSPQNSKCHVNAKTTWLNDNKFEVVPCLYRYKGDEEWYCHFINYNEEEDNWVDNTLGAMAKEYDYIIFNHNWMTEELLDINPNEWLQIFVDDIRDMILKNMNWFENWILRNEKLV